MKRPVALVVFAILGLLAAVVPLRILAAAFTAGNVVIYRVGSGAVSLVNTGNPIFLDEYTPAGALVQSIALPTTTVGANRRLIASGTATTEGLLTRSADGAFLLATGYDAAMPTTNLTTTTGSTVPRVVARVDASGNIDSSTALTDFSTGSNPRSAISSNGTDLWVAGGAGGARYATIGATTSTQISSTVTNLRALAIFSGQLYTSSQSGAFRLATVGSGLPTTSGQVITNLPGYPTATGSPYQFFFADLSGAVAGVDTVYVANDDTTLLQKWSLVSGAWTLNGTAGASGDAYRGLTGVVSGTTVTLYATRKGGSGAGGGGEFVSLVDTAGYNANFSSTTPTLRATAASNTAFRGIALAPTGVVVTDTAPSVTGTVPAAGANGVSTTTTIVVNFSESVTASASAFSVECPTGAPRTFTQTASPSATFTLTPSVALPAGTMCTVKVTASQVSDTDTADPPDTMLSDFSFSFTTLVVDQAPAVTTTSPANGAQNVPVASPIVINFSESVSAGIGAFSILCGGASQTFGQSAGPAATYTLTPSASLPYSSTCTVAIAAAEISDTDTNDPPDSLAADASFSFTTAAAPPPGAGIVRINEVDADMPGSDTAEFIELYAGIPNFPLDGLVVVLFNGTVTLPNGNTSDTDNHSYAAFDLTGYTTNAQGYFVLGNPGVPGVGLMFDPGQFGLLQNGPDAVALYLGHASDFPNGTIVTTTNLQDAIVYGTDDPNASGLLPLLNAGEKIVNENATGNGQTQSSQRCPDGLGGFRNTSPYYPGSPTPGAANNCPAPRPPSSIVISQVYGGGGNSGATYRNDFVELFNRSAGTVDLTGWSLQYASSTGSGWDSNRQPLGGTIGAGEYYLISLASGGANGANVPPANVSGQINMAAGSGKIALVSSFAALTGDCPIFDPIIADFVGYGSADCGEGSTTTAAGSNTTALFRKSGGNQDTDNNASDFSAPAAPNPRRTAPIVELGPNVLSTDPRTNGFDAPRDATILVSFTEAVDVDPGWFTLTCTASHAHTSATFAENFGGKDRYITPNDNFIAGESCTVTIFKDKIHDVDTDDSGLNTDTLLADYAWSFTVADGTAPPYPASVHLTMGNPSGAGSDPFNYLMEKPEFTVSYNRDLGRPNWVSWHLSDEWTGTLNRVDTFRPDPQIPPSWYRVQSFDFSGSGFDRGHMTPNADRDKETSTPINQATFLMSNMVAQAPDNNQGPWAGFEGYLRTLTDAGSELYIVSGPAGMGGTGDNGGVTDTLANGHVTVPSSTWKVVLVLPKDGGDDVSRVSCSTRTIAVIMPNRQGIRNDAWDSKDSVTHEYKFLTTVDAVEALTGYNFFSSVPEPYQQCIEAGTNGNNPPLVKGNQTITFPAQPDSTYGDAPFLVAAKGGASGNPVTFAASGSCTSGGLNGATITPVSVGLCTITASQAGNDIYNAAADVLRTLNVNKATAAISVSGYSGVYDGAAHGATGTATGIGNQDLTALLHLGASFTIAPGGTAHWTFDGNDSYLDASGDVAIEIAKATPLFGPLPSLTIEAGSPSLAVEGTLTLDALVPTQTVAVTIDGVTMYAPIAADGQFSATFATSSLSPANSPYLIFFAYGGDTNFNATVGSSSLVVVDTIAPVWSNVPENITVDQTSPAGAVVTYVPPTANDTVGVVTQGCVPASGSTFPVGTTTVTCTATDAASHSAVGTFTITVRPVTVPLDSLLSMVTGVGPGKSFAAKVKTAQQALAAGNPAAAASALQDLISEVNAQSGKSITASQAAAITAAAQAIIAALGY